MIAIAAKRSRSLRRGACLLGTSLESASSAGAIYRTAEVSRRAPGAPAALLPLVRLRTVRWVGEDASFHAQATAPEALAEASRRDRLAQPRPAPRARALGWTPVAKARERARISALGAGGAAYR
jgi:hypothetical protein